MSGLDTRREHYPAEALKRAEELDREAVIELAARVRLEYARLKLEVIAQDQPSNASRASRTA